MSTRVKSLYLVLLVAVLALGLVFASVAEAKTTRTSTSKTTTRSKTGTLTISTPRKSTPTPKKTTPTPKRISPTPSTKKTLREDCGAANGRDKDCTQSASTPTNWLLGLMFILILPVLALLYLIGKTIAKVIQR